MSALPGYDHWKTTDFDGEARDAQAEAARTELLADGDRLAALDLTTSETLDGDDYTALFVVLADASESGLIARLAEGTPADRTNARQLDTFARLARLADRMAAQRQAAIARELQE